MDEYTTTSTYIRSIGPNVRYRWPCDFHTQPDYYWLGSLSDLLPFIEFMAAPTYIYTLHGLCHNVKVFRHYPYTVDEKLLNPYNVTNNHLSRVY